MLIYSETIQTFLKNCRSWMREILRDECHLVVKRSRFELNGYLYPINIVLFEKNSIWGYFESDTYQIGLNKWLFLKAKPIVIKNVLRHEIAHYFCWLRNGQQVNDHGKEFRDICRSFGWGEDVFRAKMNIDKQNESIEGNLKDEKLLEKIKKLLSLSSSSNQHEAELATLKANQLLIKHHLSSNTLDQDYAYVMRVLSAKRINGKWDAIYDILRTFHVQPVYNYGKTQVYMEVTGSKLNVEIAEYVAGFLDYELDRLWNQYRDDHPQLKGLKAKNNFFAGLAMGYKKKNDQANFGQDISSKALVRLRYDLEKKVQMVYPRTAYRSSQRSTDYQSQQIGQSAGRSLSIYKGVKEKHERYLLPTP